MSNCDRKSQLSGILTEPFNPCDTGQIKTANPGKGIGKFYTKFILSIT